ncbi:MAG TPA: hypothetical protein VE174_01280 [Actinomycetota bacterium]|nr:hypothetical protein [Actinomycetota bacterium]
MDVLQCPDCELKFRFASELEQHLSLEHPEFYARIKESGESAVEAAERLKARHHHRHHSNPGTNSP